MRVFHENESCLLALSFLHNSREDGGKKGSSQSHFDKTPQYTNFRKIRADVKLEQCLFAYLLEGRGHIFKGVLRVVLEGGVPQFRQGLVLSVQCAD